MNSKKVAGVDTVPETLVFVIGDAWGTKRSKEIYNLLCKKTTHKENEVLYRLEEYSPVVKASFYNALIEYYLDDNRYWREQHFKLILVGVVDDMNIVGATIIRKRRPISQLCKLLSRRVMCTSFGDVTIDMSNKTCAKHGFVSGQLVKPNREDSANDYELIGVGRHPESGKTVTWVRFTDQDLPLFPMR